MMRAAARFHRYDAARQTFGQRDHALARHPPAHDHSPVTVQPHDAANVLAQIDPKNHHAHRSAPLSLAK
jgi:hypothetical protein